jgi:hypothetical protein
LQGTNFSTGNAQITGGSITNLLNLSSTNSTATTAQATNFSSGNAVITGGSITGDTSGTFTTLESTNFSTGNAVITSGSITGLTSLSATNSTATTAQATNFSSGNAQITGGSVTGLLNLTTTTAQATNFSSGNVVVTGGSVNATPIGATTPSTGSFTTLSATSFTIPSLNATPIGNVTPSTGSFTTLSATSFTIPSLNATPIGNATPSTGAFTTLSGTTVTASTQFSGPGTGLTGTASSLTVGNANNANYATNANYASGANVSTYANTVSLTTSTGTNYLVGAGSYATGYANEVVNQNASVSSAGDLTVNSVTATGATSNFADINATSIGATTPGTAVFTTVTASSVITANSGTNSTSATTGAVVVAGGLGVAGNVFLGNAVTINSSQTGGQDFVVKGKTDSTLVWARPDTGTYDQVVIGGNATVSNLSKYAKLTINSNDSIILPSGSNAYRPSSQGGTDVAGMFRYSTTSNGIEWFNGTAWKNATPEFTVITENQFSGDGTTKTFTLPSNQTTASAIVSLNGVIQAGGASYSYTVTGTQLTFNEAPAVGDLIDVRCLTTTTTITSLSSSTGYVAVTPVDGTGIQFFSGSAAATPVFTMATGGGLVSNDANVSVATANVATTIDSFATTSYRSAKYVIQITSGTNYQVEEALVVHNGTTANAMVYGVVQTNGNLGVVSAGITGSTVNIQFTASTAGTQVKMFRQYIPV